jgi:iron(III) transport system substrate-binding protein
MTTQSRIAALASLAGLFLILGGVGAQAQMPSPVVDGETIASKDLVEAACSEGAVTYYTAQSDRDERAIIEPFEKQFNCIKVSVISAVTGRLFERIGTEAIAGKTQADVIIITDVALAQQLIDRKLVRPWLSPLGAKYPATAKREGWWYAASGSLMYPIYNTQLVQPADLPESWKDLLDPKWKGKIATSPITIGGTAWVQYDFMATQLGADYLKNFTAQDPKLFPSYDPAVLSVARGETLIGIVSALNEYSARTREGAPVMPLYMPEGTPFTDYPMMLMANSPHPHAGELFANWYLSKTGQTQLVTVRGAYSVRDDVAPAQGNPPLAQAKPWNPGDAEILRDHDALIRKVRDLFEGH